MMQAGKDYGVRVIRPFQNFQVGFVMFPAAVYREALVRGKWVAPVEAPAEKPSRLFADRALKRRDL